MNTETIYIAIISLLLMVVLYDGFKIKLLQMEIKEINLLNKVVKGIKKKSKNKKVIK